MRRICLFLITAVLSAQFAEAEDWARFRGPNGGGRSDASLPVSWTPEANVAWKAEIQGAGVSSPIVVGNRVFVTSYSGYGLDRENPGDINDLKRHLTCFDATTGDQLWKRDVDAVQPEDPYAGAGIPAHGYASSTPVSDGERVYVFFGKSGALAFDLDGKPLWEKNLGKESDPMRWGSASSPIVYGDLLIVTASAESQAIVGLDKATGEEVWRQEASGLDGMWGTPVLVKVDDARTDLVLSVPKEVWGLDPSNGKLRWYCQASAAEQASASPIVDGENIYTFTGRGGGSAAVAAGGSGDVTESNVQWKGRDTASFGSPVEGDEYVYLISNNVLAVVNRESGERLKQIRLRNTVGRGGGGGGRFGSQDYASPVIAGDKLYYVNGKGETYVFSLGATPKQLSVNLVTTDNEKFAGTPAISNKRMYLRSDKNLYCVMDTGAEVEPNAAVDLVAQVDPEQQADSNEQGAGGGRNRERGGFGGGNRGGGFDPASFFSDRDANKDEQLTIEELEGTPLANRFADIDKDGDKAVTLEEFRSGMQNAFGRNRGGRGGGGRRGGGQEDTRPERPQRPQPAA